SSDLRVVEPRGTEFPGGPPDGRDAVLTEGDAGLRRFRIRALQDSGQGGRHPAPLNWSKSGSDHDYFQVTTGGTAIPRTTAGRAPMVSYQRFTAGNSFRSTRCHSWRATQG